MKASRMSFSRYKKIVDQIPWLAKLFRDMRDRRVMKRMQVQPTPYGFSLLGGGFLAAGYQEPVEMGMVIAELEAVEVVVDVGANSGLYTCLGAAKGKQVVAIEPVPANLQILFKNLELNGFTDKAEVFPVAVSDRIGVLPMYGRGQGASLVRGWGQGSIHECFIVPVNTLDRLLGERFANQSVFLKIDVEGVEWAVLQGADKLLRRCTGILLELSLTHNHVDGVNKHFLDTFEYLWSRGFEAYTIAEDSKHVTREMVTQWVAANKTGLESENFLFRAR